MTRLSYVKPQLPTVSLRVGKTALAVARTNRDTAQPWRAWYKTARWQRLRRQIIERDMSICQQTGDLLIGRHPAPNSPVVDHIVPHRGDEALFWDERNLQTVSKAYHDGEKARLENASR